ncbi:IS110 family transposase, partial [Martelella mangrovi]
MLQQISFVGIDVAKDRFDLFILPSGERMSVNSGEAGIARLVSRLLKLGPIKIAVEASGGYERRLALNLHEAGLVVYIVPPARVRSFARSLAQHAKTDAIDAQMIARHLETAHERLEPFR